MSRHAGIITRPDRPGRSYPVSRRFRFSIPNLRFKSGTRFELSNVDGPEAWGVGFYFGDSKHIQRRDFTRDGLSVAARDCSDELKHQIATTFEKLETETFLGNLENLQSTWSHKDNGLHPFKLIDNLGDIVEKELKSGLWTDFDSSELEKYVHALLFTAHNSERLAIHKISRFLVEITIGSIVAAFLNEKLSETQANSMESA